MKKRGMKRGLNRAAVYTLLFACVLAVILCVFKVYGKNFVYGQDGITQHAPALLYLGEAVRGVLSGQGLKMVDFSLGQGMDVLTTLAYYNLTEPLAILTAVFPPERIELAYAVLTFVRFYLAGLFACMLAKRAGAKDWSVPVAGVAYAFCGFALGGGMKHLNFGVGMMYLPLLLLGVERIFDRKGWGLYIAVVALELISNFYFAYMNTVIAVLYILVRLAIRLSYREKVAECAKDGFALLGGYMLGAALSAVVLLPVGVSFLQSSRLSADVAKGPGLLYEGSFYVDLIVGFFQYARPIGYWTAVGFVPLSAFALCAGLWGRLRRKDVNAVMLLICAAMLCIPAAGSLMNGMGYVTNRWTYVLALFVALMTATGLDALMKLRAGKMLLLSGALLAYAVVSVWKLRNLSAALVGLVFAGTALFLLICSLCGKGCSVCRWVKVMIPVIAAGSVACYSVLAFVPSETGVIGGYHDRGEVEDLSANPMSVFEDSDEDGFYRVAGAFNTMNHTTGCYDAYASALDYNATAYYWSVIPYEVSGHAMEIWSSAQPVSYALSGLGGDGAENLLASVRWLYVPNGSGDAVPPGFEPRREAENGWIYENRFALPLGYTFADWMSREDYNALSAMEKRDALLQTAVVDGTAEGLQKASPERTFLPVAVQMKETDGKMLENGVEICCEIPEKGEVFLVIHGPEQTGEKTLEMRIAGENGGNRAWIAASDGSLAFDQRGSVAAMGVCWEGETTFTIGLPQGKKVAYDRIEAYVRPVQAYENCAAALAECVLESVEVGVNKVRGTIETDGARWLQMSIPYSKGWAAKVDGRAVEVARSGGMYLGLMLEEGDHAVELTYCTPLLREGAMVSGAAALLLIALCAMKRKRKQGKTAR